MDFQELMVADLTELGPRVPDSLKEIRKAIERVIPVGKGSHRDPVIGRAGLYLDDAHRKRVQRDRQCHGRPRRLLLLFPLKPFFICEFYTDEYNIQFKFSLFFMLIRARPLI